MIHGQSKDIPDSKLIRKRLKQDYIGIESIFTWYEYYDIDLVQNLMKFI